jgi:hypothetical protein
LEKNIIVSVINNEKVYEIAKFKLIQALLPVTYKNKSRRNLEISDGWKILRM